ncbi:DUF4113 domain-containing protein [Microbacterium deminutum]
MTVRRGERAVGIGMPGLRGGPMWKMRRELLSPRCTTHCS